MPLSVDIVATPSDGLEVGELQIVLDEDRPSLIERAPIAWQEINGTQIPVSAIRCPMMEGSASRLAIKIRHTH